MESELQSLRTQKENIFEERNQYSSLVNDYLGQKLEILKTLSENEVASNHEIEKVLKEFEDIKDKLKEVDNHRLCTVCY